MKTQQEQIEFANELQVLTDKHKQLIESLETAENKISALKELTAHAVKMSGFINTYTGVEE
jgi:hypothetical protein